MYLNLFSFEDIFFLDFEKVYVYKIPIDFKIISIISKFLLF